MARVDKVEPDHSIRLIAIVGPTAVGKTAVAIELARRLDAEIISADSMAIYRGMNIGTAKPTKLEQRLAPFHMIDLVDPDHLFTVADYQRAAVSIIDRLIASGRQPLLVGGTGLYIRAVIDGLDIPSARPKPEYRGRMMNLAVEKGKAWLHDELAKVDPETAARLHPNDQKRIIRALEVYEEMGRPMSELHGDGQARYPDAVQFGLTIDRQELYSRIARRIEQQMREGLVQEVEALLDKGYDESLPALQGLGYKELAPYIRGECSLDEALDILRQSTRRFAKRQLTWFRADKRIRWLDTSDLTPARLADRMLEELRSTTPKPN